MNNNALEIKNLSLKNDDFSLKNINLEVKRGTVMGIIGRSGVGKTTLIKCITNLLPQDKGQVLFDGKTLFEDEINIKNSLGVVFDTHLYALGKPKEIVKLVSTFYKNFDIETYNFLMDKFELDKNKKIEKYSKGMKTKFNVVMALSINPNLIILDEPTEGLDPISRNEIIDLLLDIIQDESKTIIISTHILSDLEKIADYITLMDKGEIVFSMDKETLTSSYSIVQFEKTELTKELEEKITGLKETLFGVQGLIEDKTPFLNIKGVKFAAPSIEDIMILRGGYKNAKGVF